VHVPYFFKVTSHLSGQDALLSPIGTAVDLSHNYPTFDILYVRDAVEPHHLEISCGRGIQRPGRFLNPRGPIPLASGLMYTRLISFLGYEKLPLEKTPIQS